MIGAIIGDVVGSRFEFENYRGTDFELFHPDCSFTDDTICTCAVADWVLNAGEFRPGFEFNFALRLQAWCRRYPDPMGGYGGRFASWIDCPVPYESYGNGAAMRISPVAFAFGPLTGLSKAVDFVTGVSHNHPEGLKGAQVVAHAIWMARSGCTKPAIRQAVENFGYSLDFTCDQIRASNVFDETCQVTVPQALVCFLESSDFESAIRLAVSIGGDSDTIAAITGSVAEAFYGVPDWMFREVAMFLPFKIRTLVSNFYKKTTVC